MRKDFKHKPKAKIAIIHFVESHSRATIKIIKKCLWKMPIDKELSEREEKALFQFDLILMDFQFRFDNQ